MHHPRVLPARYKCCFEPKVSRATFVRLTRSAPEESTQVLLEFVSDFFLLPVRSHVEDFAAGPSPTFAGLHSSKGYIFSPSHTSTLFRCVVHTIEPNKDPLQLFCLRQSEGIRLASIIPYSPTSAAKLSSWQVKITAWPRRRPSAMRAWARSRDEASRPTSGSSSRTIGRF